MVFHYASIGRQSELSRETTRADVGDAVLATPAEMLDDAPAGERVPKTPKLDDKEQSKQLVQLLTSISLDLYEHEEEQVAFNFAQVDDLEAYDW